MDEAVCAEAWSRLIVARAVNDDEGFQCPIPPKIPFALCVARIILGAIVTAAFGNEPLAHVYLIPPNDLGPPEDNGTFLLKIEQSSSCVRLRPI